MSGASSRLGTALNRKPSNASSLRQAASRPSSRTGNHQTSAAPSYMNPANSATMNRATSPTESVGSTSSRLTRKGSPSNKRKDHNDRQDSAETNVQVVVRCRGRSDREIKENSGVILSTPGGPKGKEVALSLGPLALSNKTYMFDRVFGPEADQSMIYDDVVQPIVGEMLTGYNCTIFAYGQTGTGKTYTMSGDMEESFGTYGDSAGIIPRTLYKLFHQLDDEANEYSVKCSFIELYNEELRDLLSNDDAVKVKIFEDSAKRGAIVIQGMEESYIKSAADGVNLLQEGSYKRQVAATKCNDLSSRSHTVFTITVHVKETSETGEELLRVGKLNLVDLAGSENIGRSGAENKRAREAGMINQSLLTLGRVINALVDKSSHVPYRESKLTRLLQDSLGGRTKTCIIATVSPAKINLEETISTLDYAARAKNIQNKPQINQMTTKKALIREYVVEIERLKTDLAAARQKQGVYLTNEHYQEIMEESESRKIIIEEHERKVVLIETQIRSTREKLEKLNKSFMDLKKEFDGQTRVLEDTRGTLFTTETNLAATCQRLSEETVLRRAHQSTETQLDLLGHNLISTADSVASDVSELHSKLRRKAELDAKNQQAWAKAQGQVMSATQLVESQISNFTTKQGQFTSTITSKINGFLHAETEKLDNVYANLDARLEQFDKMKQDISTETRDATNGMNQVLEEIKTLRDDVKAKVGEGMKELNQAAELIAGDIVKELERFNEELRQAYVGVGREFKAMFDENTKHLTAQVTKAEELKVEVKASNEIAAAAQAKTAEHLAVLLKEERDRAAIDRLSLISKMSDLINANANEHDERLSRKMEIAQEEMAQTSVKSAIASEEIIDKISVWAGAEETFKTTVVQSRDSLKKRLQTDCINAEKHNVQIQEHASAIHASTVSLVDAQITNVGVQMQALDDFVTRARLQNEKHHASHISALDQLSSQNATHTESAKEDVKSIKKDVVDLNADFCVEIDNATATIEPFKTANVKQLSNLRSNMEAAVIREYIPTSHTPKKREYDYPRSLPKTAPHDELLSNYRSSTRIPLAEKEVGDSNIPLNLSPSKREREDEELEEVALVKMDPTPVKQEKMARPLDVDSGAENTPEGPPFKKLQLAQGVMAARFGMGRSASHSGAIKEKENIPTSDEKVVAKGTSLLPTFGRTRSGNRISKE